MNWGFSEGKWKGQLIWLGLHPGNGRFSRFSLATESHRSLLPEDQFSEGIPLSVEMKKLRTMVK